MCGQWGLGHVMLFLSPIKFLLVFRGTVYYSLFLLH